MIERAGEVSFSPVFCVYDGSHFAV